MWLVYAFGSALFAGLTSILAKVGIKNTDSHLATAIRTIVVLVFAWLMVFVTGAQSGLAGLSTYTLVFLVALVMSLVLLVFGNTIQEFLVNYIPIVAKLTKGVIALRSLIMMVVFILFFAILFKMLPNRKASRR